MEERGMTRRAVLAATTGMAALGSGAFTGVAEATGAARPLTDPPTGTVRVFWLKPSDVPFDQRYPDGIAGARRAATTSRSSA